VRHLKHAVFWQYALALLARVVDFPIVPDIVFGIGVRAKSSRLAVCLLIRLAHSDDGAALMVKYPRWFDAGASFPEETLRVVLVLYANQQHRAALAAAPGFAELLAHFVRTGQPFIIASIATLFEQTAIGETLFRELEAGEFLDLYFRAVGAIGEQEYYRFYIVIVDRVARSGFTRELVGVCGNMEMFFADLNLRPLALNLLHVLLHHTNCVEAIKGNTTLMASLKQLRSDPYVGAPLTAMLAPIT
jgi:hypothetical protein